MRFELEQKITEFTHIKEEYGSVTVKQTFHCKNYDDLQNIFLTLVDFSNGPLEFTVKKIEEEDD